jgi:hypothetical protein
MNGKWASHSVENPLVRQWPTKDEESADLFGAVECFDDFLCASGALGGCGIHPAV